MLLEAFESNWIAPMGPDVDAFEREMAERTGVANAVALSSGTAALHLALLLAGVERGDEVLVPSFTFIASAAAVSYVGARPVFVDCSADSWNLDPALVEETLTERASVDRLPAAVITVDLYGETADYLALESVCRRFEVPLIEDSAEALGSTYRGRAAGAFGVAGIFSFNGNKIITTSGGGMLMTGVAAMGRASAPFGHPGQGAVLSLRAHDGGVQLSALQPTGSPWKSPARAASTAVWSAESRSTRTYTAGLGGLPGISPMPRSTEGTSNYWLTCILIDPEAFGADREQVRMALEAADIESRPTWKPLHLQPAFVGAPFVGPGHCARVFDRGLCLPTGSALSPADQARVIEIVAAQANV